NRIPQGVVGGCGSVSVQLSVPPLKLDKEHVAQKRHWGTLTGTCVPHDTRDQIVDFVRCWPEKTEIDAGRIIGWLDITASKFFDWREHYGKVNEHNGWVHRDFCMEDWEKQAIIGFHHS